MKKLITILAIAIAVPSFVKAQGTINFGTATANHVIQQNSVSVGAGVATVGLYWGAQGSSAESLVLLGTTQTLNFGAINGGTLLTGAATAPGGVGTFEVRAWTGGFASYELALSSGVVGIATGRSGVFNNATGNPNPPTPTVPANLIGWTTPVALIVPEPSTIALGILGAGSLLFLRRKK